MQERVPGDKRVPEHAVPTVLLHRRGVLPPDRSVLLRTDHPAATAQTVEQLLPQRTLRHALQQNRKEVLPDTHPRIRPRTPTPQPVH